MLITEAEKDRIGLFKGGFSSEVYGNFHHCSVERIHN